ncbi:unnamed protein product [Brassicogethes aeneus]|uniref:Uncharacterized protein n=1 Tax=Brassicogethes aeneus TaxID=1431903 RepID=A0A9P0B960_BRAAE|nr:unnamed protein product [Brassicogethes aeneus]
MSHIASAHKLGYVCQNCQNQELSVFCILIKFTLNKNKIKHTNMDPLDILEKRITALELQVLPKNGEINSAQAITELLLQTHNMLTSALSCREAISSILQHLSTINNYLDPNNGETELETEAKRQYLLECYPEIKETVQAIATIGSLTSFTDSANIKKVTELSQKLEELSVSNLGIYEESRKCTENVVRTLQEYNDITSSIKMLFAQLDRAMTDIELSLIPKMKLEE